MKKNEKMKTKMIKKNDKNEKNDQRNDKCNDNQNDKKMKKCFKKFQCVAGSFFHNLISNQIETKQTKRTVDVRHSHVKHCSHVEH